MAYTPLTQNVLAIWIGIVLATAITNGIYSLFFCSVNDPVIPGVTFFVMMLLSGLWFLAWLLTPPTWWWTKCPQYGTTVSQHIKFLIVRLVGVVVVGLGGYLLGRLCTHMIVMFILSQRLSVL